MKIRSSILGLLILFSLILSACASGQVSGQNDKLVIYSGRSETLVAPIIEQFESATGIDVEVRYASTPELAATLLEEGDNSPADLFFAQDPGGLGAVIDMLAPLPQSTLDRVPERFRDTGGRWVGVSGRVRTLVYNTELIEQIGLPQTIWDLASPAWKGRIGWAPTNASFQTMVTAMRGMWGEEEAEKWLTMMLANEPVAYESNSAIVAAVGAGEVAAGLVNHYYLFRFLQEEGEGFPARNYFFSNGGPEALVMTAGVGILRTAEHPEEAQKFVDFMLSTVAQQYFVTQTNEYPVVEGVVTPRDLPSLEELNMTQVELTDLADLQGTIALLQKTGVLP